MIGDNRERFDPEAFLSVARRLNTPEASEADFRTICGRAYYAVFLIADTQLKLLPVPIRTRDSHDGPHDKVIRQAKQRSAIVATLLKELRSIRINADYVLTPSGPDLAYWRNQAQNALELAGYLLPRVRHLGSSRR